MVEKEHHEKNDSQDIRNWCDSWFHVSEGHPVDVGNKTSNEQRLIQSTPFDTTVKPLSMPEEVFFERAFELPHRGFWTR